MLLKAIKENHEKVRLWRRLLEYCRKTGEKDLQRIINLLTRLKEDEVITDLSKEFLHSIILLVLIEQAFQAYYTLTKRDSSYVHVERSKNFIEGILNKDFLEKMIPQKLSGVNKFYFRDSTTLFKCALGSLIKLLSASDCIVESNNLDKFNLLVDQFGLIDWSRPGEFKNATQTQYSLGDWTWWITCKTANKLSNEPNIIWELWSEEIAKVTLARVTPIDLSLIYLYPKKIKAEIIRTLNNKGINHEISEGWWHDVQVGLDERDINCPNKYLLSIKSKKNNDQTHISLFDWVKKKFEVFDPRISEWTALEIVNQIASKYEKSVSQPPVKNLDDINRLSTNNTYYIHPCNYLLPNIWTKEYNNNGETVLTWEKWKRIIHDTSAPKVKIVDKNNQIHDIRYTPTIEDEDNQKDDEVVIIYGLALILVGLLVRNFDFPFFWNSSSVYRNVTFILNNLSKAPVSSKTSNILKSCFSKRNRETRLLKMFQKRLPLKDDTKFDPPEIRTLSEFIEHIQEAQKILEHYQLTVQGHQPRQLIPISLIQLTRDYNPYTTLIEDDEEN